jgi:hypothetical protein
MSLSDFFSGIFGGSRDYDPDNPGRGGGPKTSLRPKLRPGSYNPTGPSRSESSGDSDGDVARQKAAAEFAARGERQRAAPRVVAPTASELIFDDTPFGKSEKAKFFSDVPYYSGKSISPPDPNRKPGLQDFINSYKNLYPSMATDLKLGLGSLKGPEAFGDVLNKMYGEELPQDVIDQAFKNFRQTSRDTAKNAAPASDGDDNFYGNYDPCPEGYRTDPVTGMCVPVMGVAYDTAPSAPAQYQGNFVGDPFPTIASGGGMTSPVVPSMDYTQPMNFTSPTITPPTPQGIAGIPLTPIMG